MNIMATMPETVVRELEEISGMALLRATMAASLASLSSCSSIKRWHRNRSFVPKITAVGRLCVHTRYLIPPLLVAAVGGIEQIRHFHVHVDKFRKRSGGQLLCQNFPSVW